MFLLWLRQLHLHGDQTPASVPPPAEGRSSPTNTPVSPPSFFILLSFVWFYVFFSTGQVLLSALSWCSACTSVPEGVFLICPWREMCSMSTYSSAILFLPSLTDFWEDLLWPMLAKPCFLSKLYQTRSFQSMKSLKNPLPVSSLRAFFQKLW